MTRVYRGALLAIRLILGTLFVISAALKLSSPADFAQSILNYRIFGIILSHWGAVMIPALEAIVGIMLLTGFWLKETLILTVSLYLIFDIMILQAFFRELDVACGCFNPLDTTPIDIYKLTENFVLTILAILSIFLYGKIQLKEKS
jgi:putative oxidoreductase